MKNADVDRAITSQFEVFHCVEDDDAVDGFAGVVHLLLQADIEFSDVVHRHLCNEIKSTTSVRVGTGVNSFIGSEMDVLSLSAAESAVALFL